MGCAEHTSVSAASIFEKPPCHIAVDNLAGIAKRMARPFALNYLPGSNSEKLMREDKKTPELTPLPAP